MIYCPFQTLLIHDSVQHPVPPGPGPGPGLLGLLGLHLQDHSLQHR